MEQVLAGMIDEAFDTTDFCTNYAWSTLNKRILVGGESPNYYR